MPLIIDGNNLLHAAMPPMLSGLDELGLCRLLAKGPWHGQRMVVVCDGAPGPLQRVESPEPDVALVYSGPNRSADDVIIAMLEQDTAARRCVVVSNDREIQRAARRRRAKVCSSDEFIRQLTTVAQSGAAEGGNCGKSHPAALGSDDVDAWLERFGLDGEQRLDAPDERWNDLSVD